MCRYLIFQLSQNVISLPIEREKGFEPRQFNSRMGVLSHDVKDE